MKVFEIDCAAPTKLEGEARLSWAERKKAMRIEITQSGALVGFSSWDSGVSCGEFVVWAYQSDSWTSVQEFVR